VVAAPSSEVAKGTVISTDPPAGTQLTQDSPVKVRVSKGNMGPVPNVVGKTFEQAKALLLEKGFTLVDPKASVSATAPAGTVTAQDPGANSVKLFTAKITLVVAEAPATPSLSPSASPSPG
jgi:eukaryotic-like serine/threonine-protein kinase